MSENLQDIIVNKQGFKRILKNSYKLCDKISWMQKINLLTFFITIILFVLIYLFPYWYIILGIIIFTVFFEIIKNKIQIIC